MRSHYTPKYLLKGFTIAKDSELLWRYDKQNKIMKQLPRDVVGMEPGFYSDADEVALNERIEMPAMHAIDELRVGRPLGPDDRIAMSRYVANMFRRSPKARKLQEEMTPRICEETADFFARYFTLERQAGKLSEEVDAQKQAEVESWRRRARKETPKEVRERIRSPWFESENVEALTWFMTWRVIETKGPSFFLTSDSPMVFFLDHGFRHPEAEFTLPVSSTHLLHGCWQPLRRNEPFLHEAWVHIVKEFNRRMATWADRWVFYCQNAPWIPSVCENVQPKLHKIQWWSQSRVRHP